MFEIIAAIIGTIYIILEYKASSWLWLFNIIMALMTSRKSPMLTMVKGRVRTIRIGRIKLFSSDMTTAAKMATKTFST